MNALREKIRNGEFLIGTHASLSDPSICEILGYLDFDYIWIDMEHTYIDCEKLYSHLNAAKAAGANAIVRIPQNDFNTLKRVMEMGVDGIVFPMIRSVEEAKAAIRSTLYPPKGIRGFGPRRAIKYGIDNVNEYINERSLEMCRFIQIEHIDAVNCIEELVKIDYLDGFIFGPCDLSGSIGELGNHYGENTRKLMERVVKTVKEHNKYMGISIGDFCENSLKQLCSLGVDMISAGADTDYLIYGAREAAKNLKAAQNR